MKHIKVYEAFLAEGKWTNIMKGVRSGDKAGPWTIVVIDSNKKMTKHKVLDQIRVDVMDAIPAFYEDARIKYPKAYIAIEDAAGQVVYNEYKN